MPALLDADELVFQRLLFQLRSSCTGMARARRPCFLYSSVCVEGLRRAVETHRMFELRTCGIRDGHPCDDLNLLMVGGDK